jgi:hypothetical protein
MVKAHSPGEAIVHVGTYVNEWIPVGFDRKITVPLPDFYQLPDYILSQGQTTQLTVPSLTWNNIALPFTHSVWTSSNPAIVTVTPDGQATAVNSGETTLSFVFATAHSFQPVTFTQRIIVPPFLQITPSLPSGKNITTLTAGKPLQCYVEALYNFAPYPFSNYLWTSSNPAVATVAPGTGRVEALSTGETLLSVTIPEHVFGDSPLLATRRLKVISKPVVRILTPLSNAGEEDISLPLHQSIQLTVESFWNNGTYPVSNPKWESSHPDIVAVNPNGLITALNPGTATITFTAVGSINPVTATRHILVSPH